MRFHCSACSCTELCQALEEEDETLVCVPEEAEGRKKSRGRVTAWNEGQTGAQKGWLQAAPNPPTGFLPSSICIGLNGGAESASRKGAENP